MRTVPLPDTTLVPSLGQGTWRMGKDPRCRNAEIAALRLGIDLVLSLIDNAEIYGDGATETLRGGGWVYQPVTDILAAHGHAVLPITLSGLGETAAPNSNLNTHVGEVVKVIGSHDDDLVLVGHSYGGMVVSGAADATPGRLRAVVYVDAYVPDAGDSVWSLTTTEFRDQFIAGAKSDGLTCAPPPNLDLRCRPHPMGSFLQAINLSGRWRDAPRKVYVGAQGWDGSPFRDLYERLI